MPYAVLRHYSNAPALADALVANVDAVRELLTGIEGFMDWGLIKTADGCVSLTVCNDKAGTDASVQVARQWIADNLPELNVSPPTVIEGEVVARITETEVTV